MIHRIKNEENDGKIAQREPNAVIIAKPRGHPIAHRLYGRAEVDHLAKHIGHDGVHTVYLQPLQSAAVPFHVNPPIKQGECQEAKAAREERHAAGPNTFDDRHVQVPQESGHGQAQSHIHQSHGSLGRLCLALSDDLSGQGPGNATECTNRYHAHLPVNHPRLGIFRDILSHTQSEKIQPYL